MDNIFQNLQTNYPLLAHYRYVLVFLAASIEGFSTIVVAGLLISAHVLKLFPAYIALVLGEIANGFLWYAVGYFGGAKPLDWLTKNSPKKKMILDKVRSYFCRYTGRAILLAKMTFSMTVTTQILVGSVKFNPKKFAYYNIAGSIGWVTMILAISYFFGQSFRAFFGYWRSLSHVIAYAILGLIFLVVLRKAVNWLVNRYFPWVPELGEKIRGGIDQMVADKEHVDNR